MLMGDVPSLGAVGAGESLGEDEVTGCASRGTAVRGFQMGVMVFGLRLVQLELGVLWVEEELCVHEDCSVDDGGGVTGGEQREGVFYFLFYWTYLFLLGCRY